MRKLLAIAAVTLAVLPAASAPAKPQPRLSYPAARQATQDFADSFAGTPTQITSLYRLGAATFSASARWERVNPTGCRGCGFDPNGGPNFDTPTTEYCSLGVRAQRLSSGRVRFSIHDSACF